MDLIYSMSITLLLFSALILGLCIFLSFGSWSRRSAKTYRFFQDLETLAVWGMFFSAIGILLYLAVRSQS